jgi:hypothetical protein
MELNPEPTDLFSLLFKKWEQGSIVVLETISTLLITIKNNLSNDNEEEKTKPLFCYILRLLISSLATIQT